MMDFKKGFTLVELLVVITIIAILSTVGLTLYSTVMSRTRDAKTKADIDSVIKALEVNATNGGYQPLIDDQFSSAEGVPQKNPKGYYYCLKSGTTRMPLDADTLEWRAEKTCQNISDHYYNLAGGNPVADTKYVKICGRLDDESSVYCRSTSQ